MTRPTRLHLLEARTVVIHWRWYKQSYVRLCNRVLRQWGHLL
jgi:hypothetical protein